MKKIFRGVVTFLPLIALFSCESGDKDKQVEPAANRAALRIVTGCDDLEAVLRQSAIRQMRERVTELFEQYLNGHNCIMYGAEEDSNGAPSSGTDGASQYSTTNTQEKGVDEADFVKNDNKYIYLLGGSVFQILKAWPAPETGVLSTVFIDGKPKSLYVESDHAVVFSSLPIEGSEDPYQDCYEGSGGWEWGSSWWWEECSARAKGDLKITILDVEDRAHPVLQREIVLSGAYVNSRRIGDAVHTVVVFPGIRFEGVKYWPDGVDWCSGEINASIIEAFLQLIDENERIINGTPFENWLPSVKDTRHFEDGRTVTNTSLLSDCRNFYEQPESSGNSFLGLLSFDIPDDARLHMASIVGRSGEVYASSENLYVATRYGEAFGRPWGGGDESGEVTTIHKFSLSSSPAAAAYEASGLVEGRVLNQFSMGEHRNTFRIATTTGYLPDPNAHNSVFVLAQQGMALDIIGSITGIAPSEDIRSARFAGDRGFIVTFKKTDPLFTIDLSDPAHPVLAGELQIPGFSTYLHMMDERHLLTIGFDADDQGDFAWFKGIQLQIFDVGDMNNPSLDQRYLIGTRGTSSEATGNHLAFNYFAAKDLLALPMALCEGGGDGGQYGSVVSFDGLMVFNVTAEDGFSERGRVPHADPGAECYNWWQNPNSGVKRSIIMDDYIFSISDTLLKVNRLDDLGTDVVTWAIPEIPGEDD